MSTLSHKSVNTFEHNTKHNNTDSRVQDTLHVHYTGFLRKLCYSPLLTLTRQNAPLL